MMSLKLTYDAPAMIRIRLLLYVFFLLCATLAIAADISKPEFLVRSWRNEEGLPHSTINSVLQTHEGYLWIGT